MSIFSDNLRKYREKTGKQAKEFAKEIDVLYSTYANYEQGRSEPKIDTLIKIADYLNVSIDTLLGYTPNEYEHTKEFLEALNITVNEIGDTIQIICPIDKESQSNNYFFSQSVFFDTKAEFIDFVNKATQKVLENNIENYIVDYMTSENRKAFETFIKQGKLYLKENPKDKQFAKFFKEVTPIPLGLETAEVNKKNPPPSEVGEGLDLVEK